MDVKMVNRFYVWGFVCAACVPNRMTYKYGVYGGLLQYYRSD